MGKGIIRTGWWVALALALAWVLWPRSIPDIPPATTPSTPPRAQPRAPTRPPSTAPAVVAPQPADPAPPPGASPRPQLTFNGRAFFPQPDAPAGLAAYQRSLLPGSSKVLLVGLNALPTPARREKLERQGLELLSYVADLGWVARLKALPPEQPAIDATELSFFEPFRAPLRLHPALLAVDPADDIPVYVHLVKDRSPDRLRDELKQAGYDSLAAVSAPPFAYLAGHVAGERMEDFLDRVGRSEEVQLVEPAPSARLMNDSARPILQAGDFAAGAPLYEQGLYGSNQLIVVCDTGLDVDSCFFRDSQGTHPPANGVTGTNLDFSLRKVVAASFLYGGDDPNDPLAWGNHYHGTMVSGCALGSDLAQPLSTSAHNGMAPGAKLIIQDAGYVGSDVCADLIGLGCPVTNFYPALLQAVAMGATIHNNSWGDREDLTPHNDYSEPCRELDLATWSNKELLVVCAAGNDTFDDTVTSPSVAKNALSVAATLNGSGQESMASFSSRGWASDGRIKPDVAAPGSGITSADSDGDIRTSNCTTRTANGTSFSSPLTAGMAALVRDYFSQGFYPSGKATPSNRWSTISAALVKAVLINSTEPMGNAVAPPPSRDQGWGRLNLSGTLAFTNSSHDLFVEDHGPRFSAEPALPYVHFFELTSTNQPLHVTLVWSDYPAAVSAAKHLVNDIDLRVRTVNTTYRGNVLSNGWSVSGGGFDRSNNVEQVLYRPATTGLVEVSVWGHLIPEGPQDFALVVSGAFRPRTLDEDTDGDRLPDVWEEWHFGNLSEGGDGDPDMDHEPNYCEFLANTDPNATTSSLALAFTRLSNNVMEVSFEAQEARRYVVSYSDGAPPNGSYEDALDFRTYSNAVEGVAYHTMGTPGVSATRVFLDDFSTNTSGAASGTRYYRTDAELP